MLKNFFAFAILTHCVISRFTPEERQWNEYDARQNCTLICHEPCTYCTEPSRCSEDEVKCGEEFPENHPDCAPDDICIPSGCLCPTERSKYLQCPLICAQECDDDEIKCSGGFGIDHGCELNDYCHPKGTGPHGPCPGYCPFECQDDEMKCTVPNDPVTDCSVPPWCIPKQKNNVGNECSHQECPLICDITERLCIGDIDHQGCKEGDTCVPKGYSNSEELCPGTCPLECESYEILCKGQTDCDTGCVESDQCNSKAKDVNGEYCLVDSASHGCPITCCDEDILCPVETNVIGCKEMEECKPRSKDSMDNFCPAHSDCPTVCQPNEVLCPDQGKHENGCDKPDVCIVQGRDFNGELCPVHCPYECNVDEVLCSGHRNEVGCEEPATCEKRHVKEWGNDKGNLCPGVCPERCQHDEILCPGQLDPCDGCPTEQLCLPKHKNINGEFCPDDSASHGCPKLCYENVVDFRSLNNEVLCPVYEGVLGCKPEAQCYQRSRDAEDEYCPSSSVCPVQCQGDEIQCSDGVDVKGCTRENLCLPKGADSDGNTCARDCPTVCTDSQISCKGSLLPNGCQGPDSCTDIGTDCPANAYSSLGCWKDTSDRAIPTLEGTNPVLDGSYGSRIDPIQKCYEAASSLGYSVFAVQNGGWCAGSATAGNTYSKYGSSSDCLNDGEGGPWANEVYQIGNGMNCKKCGDSCTTASGQGMCMKDLSCSAHIPSPEENHCAHHGCGGKKCGDTCLSGDIMGICDEKLRCDYWGDKPSCAGTECGQTWEIPSRTDCSDKCRREGGFPECLGNDSNDDGTCECVDYPETED